MVVQVAGSKGSQFIERSRLAYADACNMNGDLVATDYGGFGTKSRPDETKKGKHNHNLY
jgi:hypothetical protein